MAESPALPLTLDGTPPALTFTLATSSSYGSLTGKTVYYNSQGSGGFTATAGLSDALAGLEVVTFPTTVAPGASHLLNGATNATLSQVYLFDSGSSFSNTVQLEASDRARNEVTQTFRVFRDVLPPVLVVTVPLTVPLHFRVAWGAADGGSGLRHYDVQYKAGPLGSWQGWLTETLETSAYFLGEAGQSYSFKVSATDKVNNTATEEVGPVTVQSVTKYYSLGDQRVAMRQGSEVYYLHGDHLGSTSLTTNQGGTKHSESRYLPYGEERWASGASPTDFRYTGQRSEAGFKLYDYNARYYSAYLGRFVSPDTIVPNPLDSQHFNRYTYTANNPLKFVDRDGHCQGLAGAAFNVCAQVALAVAPAVHQANEYREDIFFPDANTTFGDRLEASTVVGGGSVLIAAGTVEAGVPIIFGRLGPLTKGFLEALGFACGDGDCKNEVQTAEQFLEEGKSQLEQFTENDPVTDWEQIPGVEGKYPSTDPNQPPGPGWEWRGKGSPGSGQGSYFNPNTGESLFPDWEHEDPIGPHIDYKDSNDDWWRIDEHGVKYPK